MGMTIAKLWDGFFGKKEMRILMVGLDAAGKVSPFFLSKENLSDTRYRQLFCINWSWEKLLQLFPLSDLMLKLLNTKTFVLPFGMSVDKIRYVKNLFCCSCWQSPVDPTLVETLLSKHARIGFCCRLKWSRSYWSCPWWTHSYDQRRRAERCSYPCIC